MKTALVVAAPVAFGAAAPVNNNNIARGPRPRRHALEPPVRCSMAAAARKALIQNMYNRRAQGYDDSPAFHRTLAQLLFAQVPLREGDAVLDLCTGTGLVALEAARRVGPRGNVVGVDFADAMLRMARAKAAESRLENVSFLLADVEHFEIRGAPHEAAFDAAFCSAAAVWLDSLPLALRRWRALLKPGGLLAFNGWTEGSFVAGAVLQHVSWPRGVAVPYWHAQTATPERCKALLQSAGLDVVTVHAEDMSCFQDPQALKQGLDGLLRNTPSGRCDGSTLETLFLPEQLQDVKDAYFARVDELSTDAGVPSEIMTFTVVGRRP
jgi:ubiquinone/menaquinone biosynthesis C-methylase UbiE